MDSFPGVIDPAATEVGVLALVRSISHCHSAVAEPRICQSELAFVLALCAFANAASPSPSAFVYLLPLSSKWMMDFDVGEVMEELDSFLAHDRLICAPHALDSSMAFFV